eukprot:4679685-Ditylum_brightwellii.AAC.1
MAIRWNIVCNLANSIKASSLPQLSDVELHIKQKKAWHNFYRLKKECSPLSSTFIEDKVKALNQQGKEKKTKKLRSILVNTTKRERAARFRAINYQENRGRIREVTKETIKLVNGSPICNQSSTSIVETVTYLNKKNWEESA